tara:strand:- start:152 stop:364 length:213 start_codon:yes stop_codon:yes gene_type:complete
LIYTNSPTLIFSERLITFLKQKINLNDSEIKLGLRQAEIEQAPLPIVLWSFGLITLEQYEKILKWQNDHQ